MKTTITHGNHSWDVYHPENVKLDLYREVAIRQVLLGYSFGYLAVEGQEAMKGISEAAKNLADSSKKLAEEMHRVMSMITL